MSNCSKCGSEAAREEMFDVQGEEMCEDCYVKYQNPSRPCGGGPGSSHLN